MTLAAAPGDQRMKNILDIDAIGLHSPRPAIDPEATSDILPPNAA
jgi:hypothetical protein